VSGQFVFGGPVTPQPGDFCVFSIDSDVGILIDLAQKLAGSGFAEFQHAYLYVGNGMIVQAQPGGAVKIPLGHQKLQMWSTGIIPLTDNQRSTIVANAEKLAKNHVGYSALDYFALAAHHVDLPPWPIKGIIENSHRQICSQLVDYCWLQGGVHLFRDGRWPGYSMPADLAGVLRKYKAAA